VCGADLLPDSYFEKIPYQSLTRFESLSYPAIITVDRIAPHVKVLQRRCDQYFGPKFSRSACHGAEASANRLSIPMLIAYMTHYLTLPLKDTQPLLGISPHYSVPAWTW